MPKDFPRSDRLASQIHRELAGLINNSVKDPRLSPASVLEVQVTKDLSQAKVYFSVLDQEAADETLQALTRASGFLQREIGRVLKSRLTPKLVFIYDDTDIRGRNMDELIDSAIAKDKANSDE
ncbi:MAG: ribosome-binding factor A [Gammaproteobacteria bacterium]|jgi:ribosome-binding factor A